MQKLICESTHAIKRWNQPWTIANKNVINSIDLPIRENTLIFRHVKKILSVHFSLQTKCLYRVYFDIENVQEKRETN